MDQWDFDDRPELPPEAGNQDAREFDPDDQWLQKAPKALQIEAMRHWFYERFENPANSTPYDGRQGGYHFICGGPYDPSDEIQERFSDVVTYEVMEELINELVQECGDEWAGVNHGDWGYDDIYSLLPDNRTDPLKMLIERLNKIEETLTGPATAQDFVIQLLHSATITALEAYLWDTTAFWVTQNDEVLRSFVKGNEDFAGEKLKLSDIFTAMEGLEKKVIEYLQTFIWHRLDKTKPLLEKTLGIKFPDIAPFMPEIVIRHDIVHRGGRNKEGYPVNVSSSDVKRVADLVKSFADTLDAELLKAFPVV
ncbi:hypothetical protein LT706_09695 [Pseudomonas syringae pv. syringae]|uniref:hypothetical protein n=1 Tax=Pseudomonas TaxID=286 RepID=UPI0006B9A11D|nr:MULTISPECIES: hypothetical protein [Pseudomonas]MCK9711802.1 hypothetical protein [Pseudomonas syringae pv. syringae]SFW42596.1 hypothetical protein SAMN03159505_01470 [Pseudomonas sp. NFACC10-1]